MQQHMFDSILSLPTQDIELVFHGISDIEWAQFLLNPRRLRGSDFLMRWSQGVWSEKRLIDAVNATTGYYAIPYGPSGTAPSESIREFELYFERLETAGLGNLKRPDLLVFDSAKRDNVVSIVSGLGGEKELPFIPEVDLSDLLGLAIVAVECENSLWIAEKMPAYGEKLRPMKRLAGKPGLRKNAVLPTVILKEEDRGPLKHWQAANAVPIHIWHVFFDRAYGLALDEAQRILDEGLIEPTVQTFQAPGGATTQKSIYKFYYHYAYELGVSREKPKLVPDFVEDKNGHILPFVRFEGGTLTLQPNALEILGRMKNATS